MLIPHMNSFCVKLEPGLLPCLTADTNFLLQGKKMYTYMYMGLISVNYYGYQGFTSKA